MPWPPNQAGVPLQLQAGLQGEPIPPRGLLRYFSFVIMIIIIWPKPMGVDIFFFTWSADVDECGDPTLNNCTTPKNWINTQGNYTCGRPKWYHGDERKDGLGCAADFALTIKIVIGKLHIFTIFVLNLLFFFFLSFFFFYIFTQRKESEFKLVIFASWDVVHNQLNYPLRTFLF